MYCSSCGLEQPQELSYCNRCGNNLRPLAAEPGDSRLRLKGATPAIATAIVLVTLGGFGMIFGLVMALITRGIAMPEGGMALIALMLLIILAVDFLLVRLLMRILGLGPVELPAAQPLAKPQTLAEPTPRRLEEPLQPVTSVTDHTTRTLPKEYVGRDKAS